MYSKIYSWLSSQFLSRGSHLLLWNLSQSKKLKGLPIGPLVSHTSKKAKMANCRKEFFSSCRELSWKAYGVGTIVVSTNTHPIGFDFHRLLILGHEEITSDYWWYYSRGFQVSILYFQNDLCTLSRRGNLCETLSQWRNNLPYINYNIKANVYSEFPINN